jgi:hypothetical protein
MVGGTAAEASVMAPMPGVLGDESSNSEGEDGGGDNASTPNEVEVRSVGHRPSSAPLVEESEDEPEHELPPMWPLNPMPLIGSSWEEDVEMDVTKATLFLGKCFVAFGFYLVFSFYACHKTSFVFTFSR